MFCGGQPGGRAHQHRALDLGRVIERPLQDLHAAERAADRRVHPRDAERAQQRPVHLGEVADGEQREVEPVRLAGRGVDRRRPGRPLAPAEQVRADDVEAVGVDRLARARSACPTRPRPRRRRSARGRRRRPATRRRHSARTRSRAARSRAPDSSVRPSGRTSVSTTRAPRGDDAGVEPREVQPAVEARVLDLHAAVGDDVEAGRDARSRPPRRCAARAASRTRRRRRRPPRCATAGSWSARRKTSTRSGGPGSSASDG